MSERVCSRESGAPNNAVRPRTLHTVAQEVVQVVLDALARMESFDTIVSELVETARMAWRSLWGGRPTSPQSHGFLIEKGDIVGFIAKCRRRKKGFACLILGRTSHEPPFRPPSLAQCADA